MIQYYINDKQVTRKEFDKFLDELIDPMLVTKDENDQGVVVSVYTNHINQAIVMYSCNKGNKTEVKDEGN